MTFANYKLAIASSAGGLDHGGEILLPPWQ